MTDISAMTTLLIHSGRVVDPSQNLDGVMDLWIENGRVAAIDKPGSFKSKKPSQTVDAKGCLVLPGLIDAHVHYREPGGEHKETIATGAAAAVAGGFTSVACMANTSPTNDSGVITEKIHSAAEAAGLCRVFPIGAVTVGLQGERLAAIGEMVLEGAVAISDDGMPVMNSLVMRRAMEYARSLDIPVISHAEDANLVNRGVMNESIASFEMGLSGNPAESEEIMIAREIALTRLTGAEVHIGHLSTAKGAELVARAKEEGLRVTAEACPHHLTHTDSEALGYNTHCKMAPPLRSKADVTALQKGLASGVIDLIATDHAPHAPHEKNRPFAAAPMGVIGIQTVTASTYAMVEKGALPLSRWVEAMTSAPAKLLRLDAGTLKVGAAADVTVFDPTTSWTLNADTNQSKSKNSPLWNLDLKGRARTTIVGGDLVFHDNKVTKGRSHPARPLIQNRTYSTGRVS